MPKPKHLYNVGDRVRVIEPRLVKPYHVKGFEFTVTEVRYRKPGTNPFGPFYYLGGLAEAPDLDYDTGIWEQYLEPVSHRFDTAEAS